MGKAVRIMVVLVLAIACSLLSGQRAVASQNRSVYTPIGAPACKVPPPEIAGPYESLGLSVEECPAVEPYRLLIVSSDVRSWVEIRRGDVTWSTEQRVVYGKDSLRLGNFPNVSGSGVAEWRMGKSASPLALIFRLKWVDPVGSRADKSTVSRLFVIGLASKVPCDLGLVHGNDAARARADQAPVSCSDPLPVSGDGNEK